MKKNILLIKIRMMKNTVFYALTTFFLFAFTYAANELKPYKIDSDFSMIIKGTSNVHDWQSEVESLSGNVDVSVTDGVLQIASCDLTIPVRSIKSEKGSIMDKKTYKAMKESEHPNVKFSLTAFEAVDLSMKNFSSKLSGDLRIAGVTNRIEMTVKGNYMSDTSIELSGSKDLKMTDFGIDPPVALLGAMKTGNDISIEFQIKLMAD